MQHFSIKFRLSFGFFLLLFLVIFLGVFSIICLNEFNGVADQIRNRWLPNTRFLGDLNNYTSDFRAAEGTLLLAASPADIAASEKEIDDLDQSIAQAQRGYEHIYHDDKEINLYRRFSEDWSNYRKNVNYVLASMRTHEKENGVTLYKTTSQLAYNTASDALGLLTGLNVAEDQLASDHATDTYRKVRFLIVFAMLLGTLLVAVGVMYIRRSISAPMLDLAERMHRLASNDTSDREADVHAAERRDEVGEMARALVVFRSNMAELAYSRQGLIQQASMLEEKLKYEQNLMAVQQNFISIATHEFRTPLNIIDGHAQRLLKMNAPAPVEHIAERAGKIRGAVKQITALLDNLINSSRLFEGQPELYFHPVEIDLAVLLRNACQEYRMIEHDAQIVEKIEEQSLKICGDPQLLMQMFGNLLSNAVKYSPTGSLIEVSADADSSHVAVMVRDHGIGIPQKDIDGLFERYFRGSNVSAVSGTGIGLYLARMVVDLHGGDIAVESREGEGAVFTVRLPLGY